MRILLHAEDQLDAEKAEAIEAFRRGELDRSLLMFEAILEHWPLDQTASLYRSTIRELLDWGIDPSFLEAHWDRVEALMQEKALSLSSYSPEWPSYDGSTPQEPELPVADFTRPHWTSSWTPAMVQNSRMPEVSPHSSSPPEAGWSELPPAPQVEQSPSHSHLPKELQIVLSLHQSGRRKAACLWAQSYFETRPDSVQTRTHLRSLPQDIQDALARKQSQGTPRPIQLSEISPRNSHATPQDPQPKTRRSLIFALGLAGSLLILQALYLLLR